MRIISVFTIVLCVIFVVACKQQNGNAIERKQQDSIVSEQKFQNKKVIGQGIHLEKKNGYVYCYADSQSVVFNDEYLDDGAFAMSLYQKDRYAYIVGDIMPNSNGWTVRYHLYRIDTLMLSVKHIGDFAAIKFGDAGFKAATARLLNTDAKCTADERYAIRDNYYNYNGVLIRKDKDEYAYDGMEREYGDTLVNAVMVKFM